jgi:hypothetical protein
LKRWTRQAPRRRWRSAPIGEPRRATDSMDGRALAGSALTAGDAWAGHRRQIRRAAMPPRLFGEPSRPSGHGVTICTSLCNGHSSIAPRGALIGRRDLALRLVGPLKGLRRAPRVDAGTWLTSMAGLVRGTAWMAASSALNPPHDRQVGCFRTGGLNKCCQPRVVPEVVRFSTANCRLRRFLDARQTLHPFRAADSVPKLLRQMVRDLDDHAHSHVNSASSLACLPQDLQVQAGRTLFPLASVP